MKAKQSKNNNFELQDDFDLSFDFAMPDFDSFDDDFEFETRYIQPNAPQHIEEHFLKYDRAEKLAAEIKLSKNCRYFVIVNGTFYFGDFIEAVIRQYNFHVKKMTISTLSLNENNVDSLQLLMEKGFVDNLDLIVSDFFYAHERRNLIPYIYKELDIDNRFQLAAVRTHTKMCIFETHQGAFICIHGSANLRTSDNLEQIVIEENESLYRFNDEWQSDVIEKYKTIDKQVAKSGRGKDLWKAIAK